MDPTLGPNMFRRYSPAYARSGILSAPERCIARVEDYIMIASHEATNDLGAVFESGCSLLSH